MSKYHFSAKFTGLNFTYHGEFTTAHTDKDEIVKVGKRKLLEKLKVWNLSAYQSKLIYFKIYTYENGEEETEIFLYKQ